MNRVGMLREVIFNTLEWCNTIGEEATLHTGYLILCIEDIGYVRVLCLDDGHIWHLTQHWFDQMMIELPTKENKTRTK
jgi:hypothetical protein